MLDRSPLHVLDTLISSVLDLPNRIAIETRQVEMSDLQWAAAQIVPQGINLVLGIRELLRQGHLFSGAVLLPSLVERAAIISYLYRKPDALLLWNEGWKHGERRPSGRCSQKRTLIETSKALRWFAKL
jgi:hypothetical protein